LVAVDPAIFGLFRMYGRRFELQVGGSAVGVFTTLDDAIEWVTPDILAIAGGDDFVVAVTSDDTSTFEKGTPRPLNARDFSAVRRPAGCSSRLRE